MVKLYENGVYLLHGRDIIEDGPEAAEKLRAKNGHKVLKTEAAEQTISYRILKTQCFRQYGGSEHQV